MSQHVFKRAGFLAATIGITGFLGAGIASAHVTANVYGEQPAKGGYAAIFFRVPNEEPAAGTSKVEVELKPEYAIGTVRTKPVPGWTAKVEKAKLPTPITKTDGSQITEAVSKVSWTADAGGGLPAGTDSFQEFEISLGALPTNVDQLEFPATQTYTDGKVVNWNEATPAGGEEPEHPAPVVKLAAKAAGDDHAMAGMASTTGAQTEAAAPASDTTARWLGGAGLIVGALGLGAGAGAILRARKTVAASKNGQ